MNAVSYVCTLQLFLGQPMGQMLRCWYRVLDRAAMLRDLPVDQPGQWNKQSLQCVCATVIVFLMQCVDMQEENV